MVLPPAAVGVVAAGVAPAATADNDDGLCGAAEVAAVDVTARVDVAARVDVLEVAVWEGNGPEVELLTAAAAEEAVAATLLVESRPGRDPTIAMFTGRLDGDS